MFLELAHDDKHGAAAETWDIRTCRSRVGVGGVNPRWGEAEDKFSFRFAIPTHHIHTLSDANKSAQGGVENAWSSTVTEESKNAARGLESLFQAMYTGPPIMLNCSVFHKNKLFPHHFMGKGKVRRATPSSVSSVCSMLTASFRMALEHAGPTEPTHFRKPH